VHLHCHTEYSLLDGAVRVGELISGAQKRDMPAVAMTDHGVLYGIIDFYRRARKAGVKPLLGCEVYLAPGSRFEKKSRRRFHLVLLARNKQGYHNLIKIVSQSWLEGFYYKPRVDKDLLYEYREGLIALSACIEGEVSKLLREKKKEGAREAAREYRQIFGKENFFLELQDHNLPEEKRVNSKLISLGNDLDLPLVVTNDIHYLERDDADLHDLLLALQTGTTVHDEDRLTFQGQEFYFKTTAEMKELFPQIGQAYRNTVQIADRCQLEIEFNKFHLPDYPDTGQDESTRELLLKKCEQGLKERDLQESKEARERLDYELGIIEEMGYISYFLIVHDFVAYAEEQGIRVGPGRGSAAGSLVSYLLGITKINPLEYGLIFERFLNPQRVTMPDIDIDFDERRDEIIEYVKQRYGQEKVAQIGTFGTMAARGAIRDVGRALDIAYGKVDRIAKMVPSSGASLDQVLEGDGNLKKIYQQDEEAKKLLDFARRVEGLPRHISTHAAGVIIGPEKLTNFIPLQYQDESVITQLPMEELEELGLLKMDFLGLRNLTIIEKALNKIKDRYDKEISIDSVPLDDPKVYHMLQKGKTLGVFQMESYLFRDLNKKLRPERFEDLIALLALGRPGPLGSGLVEDYIKGRHGEKEPEYLHPDLEPILKETFGLILYQEQVMRIASEIGGYSMGQADILRRGMGKKKPELIAREREKFVAGALKNGLQEDTAHDIFDQMEYFAGYGFNKSHSAAYALLAYQTAYLKVNYPAEFMAALLSTVMNNLDKVGLYIKECREMDIEVLPPDVNESGYEFSPNQEGNIRFGLKAVKNVGKNAIKSIVQEQKKGRFSSPVDFLERVDLSSINIRTLESLIKSGALDSLGVYRSRLLMKYEEIYEQISMGRKERSRGQTSFFDLVEEKDSFYSSDVEYPRIEELSLEKRLNMEQEYLGIYVSGHPLDSFSEKIEHFTNIKCENIFSTTEANKNYVLAGIITACKEHITRRDNRMAFVTLKDDTAEVDITVFPDLYQKVSFLLEEGSKVLVVGYCNDDSFVARNVLSLATSVLEINLKGVKKGDLKKIKQKFVKQESKIPLFFRYQEAGDTKLVLADRKYWGENEKISGVIKDSLWQLY
ncbi:MAG: DNA polymerase III subunit alpha, partial [Halanaerobiaceae bacterium]